MITMEGAAPTVEAPKPTRTRAPRKSGEQALKASLAAGAPVAKSKNAEMGRLTCYVPHQLLKKLDVAAVILDKDKSDIVAELIAEKFSGVTYYDRNLTRMPGEPLPVMESAIT